MSDNTVTIALNSYNATKSENIKLNLFFAFLMRDAGLSAEHDRLVFDSDKVAQAVRFCFEEDYRKKLSALRAQSTKKGNPV